MAISGCSIQFNGLLSFVWLSRGSSLSRRWMVELSNGLVTHFAESNSRWHYLKSAMVYKSFGSWFMYKVVQDPNLQLEFGYGEESKGHKRNDFKVNSVWNVP